MPFSSVSCQKCNGTIACYKSLTHLTHMIKLCFLCSMCQMPNINTFNTSTTDALREKKKSKIYLKRILSLCLKFVCHIVKKEDEYNINGWLRSVQLEVWTV